MKGSLSEILNGPARPIPGCLEKEVRRVSRVSLFGDQLHLVTENDEQKRSGH